MNIPEEVRLTEEEYKKLEGEYTRRSDGGFLLTNPYGLLRVGAEAQLLKAIPIIEKQARREIGEWLGNKVEPYPDAQAVYQILLYGWQIEALKQGELP